jgi:nucleoside-diphosphate-sugar epimerase
VRVVVTGSAGFLGRAVVDALVAQGRPVLGIDRREAPDPTEHSHPTAPVVRLRTDLLDPDDRVVAALAGATAVVHLAGCPGVRDEAPDIATRRARDNVGATARVLALAPRAVPLVVASSSSVYGGSHGAPSAETDPLSPLGGYARSKARVEALCGRRAATGGHVTVVRPFTLLGEGQRPDMAVARWVAAARAGRPLHVHGSLDRTRDFTDVRDAARAVVGLVEPGRAPGGVLNLGTGTPRSLAEVVDVVRAVTGTEARTVVVPAAAEEPPDTWACTQRLRDTVGFVPATDLHAVVARQVAAAQSAAAPGTPSAVLQLAAAS